MSRHERLLEKYAAELAAARQFAIEWWANLHERELQHRGSPDAAAAAVKERWPDGPASHPRVIAVVRKYWLACQSLNEVIARERAGRAGFAPQEPDYVLAPGEPVATVEEEPTDEQEVYPHIFVLEWLMDDEMQELGDFLGTVSYWPVGRDPNIRDHYV